MKNCEKTPALRRPFLWQALPWVIGMACGAAWAADKVPERRPAPPKADIEASTSSDPKEVGNRLREALGVSGIPNKKLTFVIGAKKGTTATLSDSKTPVRNEAAGHGTPPAASTADRQFQQARAKALGLHIEPGAMRMAAAPHSGELHWSYEGATGPQSWAKLQPEFNLCAIGRRQSPINIEDGTTLQGPAEMLHFRYAPSNATVVNNGHTIQVDVEGDNTLTVRATTYRLVQFHFHTPSEEQINYKRSVMVAHLVHRNDEGQLAVVAVLLEPGAPSTLIDKVWTYMPLDSGDRVRMPPDMLNLSELLPTDQRYYQFMGSLTTPPCTEGVLWMVLKQPMTIGRGQYKIFSQLYPNNARPVQPLNGRPVREAQ